MTQTTLVPVETPEAIVERAIAEQGGSGVVHRLCMLSGGVDSTVLAHRCRDLYDELLYLDTGLALPGVREHAERVARIVGKPLTIASAAPGAYREIVLGERGIGGFPGPPQHTRCYVNLKQRPLEATVRARLEGAPRTARVLVMWGVRRPESRRRRRRPEIERRGRRLHVLPLADWQNDEVRAYLAEHDLPESEASALLHRSGECNCGAMADPSERQMIRDLYPNWWARTIAPIEAEAEGRAYPCWAPGRPANGHVAEAELGCSGCATLFDDDAAPRAEGGL